MAAADQTNSTPQAYIRSSMVTINLVNFSRPVMQAFVA